MTNQNLEIMGRTRCELQARGGASVTTIMYVVKGAKESLLGLQDGEALGIIKIEPDGESVRRLEQVTKQPVPEKQEVVSDGQTQQEIDQEMEGLVKGYPKVFHGLGRATKMPPVHIEIDSTVPPVQQK